MNTGVSRPGSMGTPTHPEASHWKTVTGDCGPGFPASVRIAVAAATPVPLPFMLNNAGATGCTATVKVCAAPALRTVTVAVPAAVPSGTTKLTCPGETK